MAACRRHFASQPHEAFALFLPPREDHPTIIHKPSDGFSWMRYTLPMTKMYDSTPIRSTTVMNIRAPLKSLLVLARMIPITMGVTIDGMFANTLKTPPVRPCSSLGAISPTSVHDILDIPWQKNATAIIAITTLISAT